MVEEIHTDYWIVNGIRFEVLPNSKIEKGIKVGDFVEVEFGRNQAGEYILLEAEFDDSEIYGVADESTPITGSSTASVLKCAIED